MKKVVLGLMAIILVALPLAAQTQPPARVAVIQLSRIADQSAAGKAAKARLETIANDKDKKFKEMQNELSQLQAKYSPSLDESVRGDLEKKIADKRVAVQRYAEDAQRDLQQEEAKERQKILTDIQPIINEIGKEMGFAIIFSKDGSGILYASDAVDITSIVIKRYDEKSASSTPTKKN